jgi:hypothetical protein
MDVYICQGYQARIVSGHVYVSGVPGHDSERSCMCQGYQARKMSGRVYMSGVPGQDSERSCICVRGTRPG